MIILDSSALIELLDGSSKGKNVQQAIANEVAGITTLTIHEVGVGMKQEQSSEFRTFLSRFTILPFDADSSLESIRIEQHLTKTGKMIGRFDILIAGICLAQHAIMCSFDKDFQKIPGLQMAKV